MSEHDTQVLERITIMAETRISMKLAEEFALEPQVRVYADSWFNGFAIFVRQSILSQKLNEITVRYPANWWQAVKERFAPRWFRRRWPVEWSRTTIDVRAVYPKMTMPGKMHSPLARILEGGTAIVDGWGEYVT